MKNIKYVLASASPRRIEIMNAHGLSPLVIPAKIDETLPAVGEPEDAVMFLALKKAKAVEEKLMKNPSASQSKNPPDLPESSGSPGSSEVTLILAADTVVYQDKIMGKPSDKAEGFQMLSKLRNREHKVITGVAIVAAGQNLARIFTETTKVYFKDYTDEELNSYLDTDEAYDKAGGYAIQGYFSKYIDKIEGDYDNVVGFPWHKIEEELHFICSHLNLSK